MRGRFRPASGGSAVAVKVASVFASLAADGGEAVGLVPAHSAAEQPAGAAPWLTGEWGRVTLEGPARRMIPVPSEALIIDRARWWVLVRTAAGDRPQAVVPGPTRGWETFIEKGLVPGEQVVVQNAYLEFHRGISRQYTPPNE
jgi:cobalt-zinc-cadmium efflux system membrane fusion protein